MLNIYSIIDPKPPTFSIYHHINMLKVLANVSGIAYKTGFLEKPIVRIWKKKYSKSYVNRYIHFENDEIILYQNICYLSIIKRNINN